MPRISITVNERRRTVNADPETPLLWVLRDELGLTGTKYGCGVGVCGACTVLADGKAVRSCTLPLKEAGARKLTTIEGLSADGSSACQRAWLEEDVAQCGYCQPGMILGATALLAAVPAPTDADIDRVFDTHVCRCGTYPRIRKAIHRAAGQVK